MARKYTPRRAGKRWLEGAPPYILDVIWEQGRNATADCITVLLTGDMLLGDGTYPGTHVQFIGLDTLGRGYWGELTAHQTAAFRYHRGRHRVTWASLPDVVKREARYRVEGA